MLSRHRPFANFVGPVRVRNEPGFELRRREIDTVFKHEMEEALEPLCIGSLRAVPISYGFFSEEEREH